MNDWISVKDRLPDGVYGKTVLCYTDGIMKIGYYTKVKNTEGVVFRVCETGFGFYPTHWLPLPEPPKEDSRD